MACRSSTQSVSSGTSHRVPIRSIPASPSKPESWQSLDAEFYRLHGEKPTSSHIPSRSVQRLTAARPSVRLRFVKTDSGAQCEINLLIDSCLAFSKMDGFPDNERTGHDEARSGPRRVAVRTMSAVCSQRLPQTCWLEFRACDESRSIFPCSDFQKFDRYVRHLHHFNFVRIYFCASCPKQSVW